MHIRTSLKTEKKTKTPLSIVANGVPRAEILYVLSLLIERNHICLKMALGEAFTMPVLASPELGSMCFSLR